MIGQLQMMYCQGVMAHLKCSLVKTKVIIHPRLHRRTSAGTGMKFLDRALLQCKNAPNLMEIIC